MNKLFNDFSAALISNMLLLISSLYHTLLKIKVLYWHLWFLEEHLTSRETFHCAESYFSEKKFIEMFFMPRTVH